MMPRLILLLLFYFTLSAALAQAVHKLHFYHSDTENTIPEHFLEPLDLPGNEAVKQGVNAILMRFHQKGYLLAKCDTIILEGAIHKAFVKSGELFSWFVDSTNINQAILRKLKLENLIPGKPIPYEKLSEIKKSLVLHYENNGYPFARVYMDQVEIEGSVIKGTLVAEPMDLITFDDLQLSDNVEINSTFVSNHTGIGSGQIFSQKIASGAVANLTSLPFIRLTGEPTISFSNFKARISVPAEPRPSNRFDGVAGLSGAGTNSDPYRLTGSLNLFLTNTLARGETFMMKWQGMGYGTQSLELRAQYPYIFSTPIITAMQFSLHKQDSSYISVRRRPEFAFRTRSNILIAAFADILSTDLLNPSQHDNPANLPEQIDTRVTFYGIDFKMQSPGFISTFRQGSSLGFSVAAGSRKVKVNSSIDPGYYDDVNLQQNQLTTTLDAVLRHPLSENLSLVFQLEAASIIGQQLFENELFRIGGFNSLKGFEEESIIASSYSILTNEVRFFSGEMSFVSLFYNVAWFEKKLPNDYQSGWPWGVGAGLTLATAPGMLSVYFATSKSPGAPIEFRNTKIHFGFITLF